MTAAPSQGGEHLSSNNTRIESKFDSGIFRLKNRLI
jgi:hypothetical protein